MVENQSQNVAKKYFEVSNQSDFDEIQKLLVDTASYSSQNTGLYLWANSIIEMQKKFHWSFEKLEWRILQIYEEKPGIVYIDFDFSGIKSWVEINFSGIEYILVVDEKIQHIEIKNK